MLHSQGDSFMPLGRPRKYATPEESRKARNAQSNESKRRKRESLPPPHFGTQQSNRPTITPDLAAAQAAEFARMSTWQPSVTAAFCGDPPPWRSALGRREQK